MPAEFSAFWGMGSGDPNAQENTWMYSGLVQGGMSGCVGKMKKCVDVFPFLIRHFIVDSVNGRP